MIWLQPTAQEERDRQLAYIARELERGDREPSDVTMLKKRRDELLRGK